MKFHLNVRTDCEMVVEIEANSMQEARDRARAANWDEALTHWQPLSYDKVRVAWTEQQPEDWRCSACGHMVDSPQHELGCGSDV